MGKPLQIVGYDRKNPDIAQVANETRVYGAPNKPRNEDPSMKDLLSWSVADDEKSQYKTDNVIKLNQANELEKYKLKINKSSTDWVTENHDNFRKYGKAVNQSEQEVIPVDLKVINKLKGASPTKANEKIADQPFNPSDYHTKIKPKNCSTYQEEYSVKDIKNLDTLRRTLEQNKNNDKKAHQKNEEQLYLYDDGRENQENQQQPEVAESQQEDEGEANDGENQAPQYETFIKKKKKKLVKTKKLDPIYEQERLQRRRERIKQFKLGTRELPNSAFTSYYGKVPFQAYGNQNVKPAVGGFCYGNYMRSHNVNPHRGDNKPEYVQTYNNSILYGQRNPVVEHQPPRVAKEEYRLSQNDVQHLKNRSQIVPPKNNINDFKLVKPDLEVQRRFASKENSPAESEESDNEDIKIMGGGGAGKPATAAAAGNRAATPNKSAVASQDGTAAKQRVAIKDDQKDQTQKRETSAEKVDPAVYQSADPARKNFIDDLKEQKIQQNRIAKKVTEVVPVAGQGDQQTFGRPQSANPLQNQSQSTQIDQSNVGTHDLSEYNEFELNPKNYQNVDQQWLDRIPYAGQQQEKSENVKSVFYADD